MSAPHTIPNTGTTKGDWAKALAILFVTLLAILVIYRDTALAMAEIWARSETFTHGFLVPPIALWLVWRIRHRFVGMEPRPSRWFLLVPAGAGFLWLLGELSAVGVVSQFALVTIVVFSVPAVLGLRIARRIAFPLAFLYFAVPFGEFAIPFFMEWTAKITVIGLRMSGIPVYREGLQFIIPSGSWSVVEACSGIRYLIASVTVGTLFAYLSYTSLKRRVLFVAVSFVVPIIANWFRAYLIVMLGHLSGNKLAAGVDHLIYGWVFFGIVMMAMFWIGSRWREEELQTPPGDDAASTTLQDGRGILSTALTAVIFFLIAVMWPFAEWKLGSNLPPQVTRVEPPGPIAGWTVSEQPVADWSPYYENPSATFGSSYASKGRTVGLFVAYYRNQDYSRKMISSNNRLVAGKDLQWSRVSSGKRDVDWTGRVLTMKTAELKSSDSRRLTVWQFYWVNGHLTASDAKAKVYTALSRLTGRGDDSAVVFIYAPEQADGAPVALEQFSSEASSAVMDALDRTGALR
ncbi:MAG: exosortase A [Propionivibrio sp.]